MNSSLRLMMILNSIFERKAAIMTPLFKKLNFKDHGAITILESPDTFAEAIKEISPFTKVKTSIENDAPLLFVMVFVTEIATINSTINSIYPLLEGDAILWYCYPKKSSKKYTCNFSRDNGWEIMGTYNMEAVRMVAIDQDWSAIRFRKIEFIKKMTRSKDFALSKKGKLKTSGK